MYKLSVMEERLVIDDKLPRPHGGRQIVGMISTNEFLVLMEPLATYLTCKTKKPNGGHEVRNRGVPAKGILTV